MGLILDSKLKFGIHIKSILAKVNKTIGLIISVFYLERP